MQSNDCCFEEKVLEEGPQSLHAHPCQTIFTPWSQQANAACCSVPCNNASRATALTSSHSMSPPQRCYAGNLFPLFWPTDAVVITRGPWTTNPLTPTMCFATMSLPPCTTYFPISLSSVSPAKPCCMPPARTSRAKYVEAIQQWHRRAHLPPASSDDSHLMEFLNSNMAAYRASIHQFLKPELRAHHGKFIRPKALPPHFFLIRGLPASIDAFLQLNISWLGTSCSGEPEVSPWAVRSLPLSDTLTIVSPSYRTDSRALPQYWQFYRAPIALEFKPRRQGQPRHHQLPASRWHRWNFGTQPCGTVSPASQQLSTAEHT